jgi:hypothetical protein
LEARGNDLELGKRRKRRKGGKGGKEEEEEERDFFTRKVINQDGKMKLLCADQGFEENLTEENNH